MINPDILSTKAFGLVLSISVVGEMILSLVKKEQFQKEEFSPKIKITAGIMIVLLLAHLIFEVITVIKGSYMENTDIPQFRTYRGEIELEGVVIQVDIFVDNEMLEDRNSFLISFCANLIRYMK